MTTPTRDVDVTYRATVAGKPVEQRSRFTAAGRVRIDTPSAGLYVIVDRDKRTMRMVSGGDRTVLTLPFRADQAVSGVATDQAFARLGTDVVSGVPCTEWQTGAAGRQPLALCFTDDGVLLRVRAGANVAVLATRVSYGPIDPSVFAVPPDYSQVDPPAR